MPQHLEACQKPTKTIIKKRIKEEQSQHNNVDPFKDCWKTFVQTFQNQDIGKAQEIEHPSDPNPSVSGINLNFPSFDHLDIG